MELNHLDDIANLALNGKDLLEERESKLIKLVSKRQTNLTVVMDNIHDPHNIHAILRTCDAVGIPEVFVIYNKYPKKIKEGKKSSAAAKKWVEINLFTSYAECVKEVKENRGFELYATHLTSSSKSLYDMNFTKKVALVFGNEQTGISEELLEHCGQNFIIPMLGMTESLNVSVATSITLYEAYRQRLESGMLNETQSSVREQEILLKRYSFK